MNSHFANRLFRITFFAAGLYNLAFGLWAALWPMAFFDVFDIERPRYSGIWACLGMVVGVYGLLYLHAAWRLEIARSVIAAGLLGKVLGPIGMVMSFSDEWPRRLGMLCVWNDLIWWLPFGLFLLRDTAVGRKFVSLAPWFCVVSHVAGLALIATVLRPGTPLMPNADSRAQYIAEHVAAWSLGWGVWMAAAASLVGFYAWWGGWLCDAQFASKRPATFKLATAAVLLSAAGMACDFTGEALSVLVVVEQVQVGEALRDLQHSVSERLSYSEGILTLLTAGVANALYTMGGVLLMLVTPGLPRGVLWAMIGTWAAGAAMTACELVGSPWGVAAATAVLFPLLIGWVSWMGMRWRPE